MAIFSFCILYGGLFYDCLISIVYIFVISEWYNITKSNKYFLILGGIFLTYAFVCILGLMYLFESPFLVLMYFISIWSTDVFAMIGGKTFGGPKLAIKISPQKTWSGLFCGFAGSFIITMLFIQFTGLSKNFGFYGLWAAINPFLSQLGDLFISLFKRRFNVKDSGNIIPGHGGILDRFDSVVFTAPVLLFWQSLCMDIFDTDMLTV